MERHIKWNWAAHSSVILFPFDFIKKTYNFFIYFIFFTNEKVFFAWGHETLYHHHYSFFVSVFQLERPGLAHESHFCRIITTDRKKMQSIKWHIKVFFILLILLPCLRWDTKKNEKTNKTEKCSSHNLTTNETIPLSCLIIIFDDDDVYTVTLALSSKTQTIKNIFCLIN